MPVLTEEQKAVLRYVGGADHDEPYLPTVVLEELRLMGLLICRSGSRSYGLTNDGERLYESMASLIY